MIHILAISILISGIIYLNVLKLENVYTIYIDTNKIIIIILSDKWIN
jgi:hypothetical protein